MNKRQAKKKRKKVELFCDDFGKVKNWREYKTKEKYWFYFLGDK